LNSHVNPVTCIWARSPARKPDDLHVGNAAQVHI